MTDYHALHCEAHAWALKNAAEEQNAALRARVAELEGKLARVTEAREDARVMVQHLQIAGFPSGFSTVRTLAERVLSILNEAAKDPAP